MTLREYLFVDTVRLQSYAQDIGSTVTYDKVPTYKGEISLAGISAGVEQTRHARVLTQAEQLDRVISYLKKQRQAGEGRLEGYGGVGDRPFRFEKCLARKIFLPALIPEDVVSEPKDSGIELELPRPGRHRSSGNHLEEIRAQADRNYRTAQREKLRRSLEGFDGLTLWYSAGTRSPQNDLYLIQNFGKSDEAPELGSAFSVLSVLISEAADQISKTVLHAKVPQGDLSNPTSRLLQTFAEDPLATLRQLGGRTFDERPIDVLYRVRKLVPQAGGGICTIAYPLYIGA